MGLMTQDDIVRCQAAYQDLLSRASEQHIEPRLEPVRSLCDLLGNPQNAYPTIHITGTNGKTSTARYIEALLKEHNLRVGRFTSPHLVNVTERIVVDGAPIAPGVFADTWEDIAPYVAMVDGQLHQSGEPPLTFFELLAVLAYAAFAQNPIDVGVIEVGLGGAWDATNVINADVAVITPISLDHTNLLGDTVAAIAAEKAGIIKENSSVVTATQPESARAELLTPVRQHNLMLATAGDNFSVADRTLAVGGQMLSIQGIAARYDDVFLPVHGAHQADNAALALAAVEVFLGQGSKALPADVVAAAFHSVKTPGRLELLKPGPALLIDAAHNPAGLEVTLAAFAEAFSFDYTVALVGVLDDKDAETMLAMLEPVVDEIVVTQSSSPRAISAEDLYRIALDIFDEDDVQCVPKLDDAVAVALNTAEAASGVQAGVLATGSVTIAGEIRLLAGPAEIS